MRFLLSSLLILSTIGGVQTSSLPRNRAEQQQGSGGKTGSADKASSAPKPPSAPAASVVDQPTPTTKQSDPPKEPECILKKAFAPENWPHWALFGAALWAGYIALKTLRAIHQEAIEIKAVGEAAQKNAAAAQTHAAVAEASTGTLKNIYRAWALVGSRYISGSPPDKVEIFIKNWGQTPCKIEFASCDYTVLLPKDISRLPVPADYGSRKIAVPKMLAPQEDTPLVYLDAQEVVKSRRDDQWREVSYGLKEVVCYGIVRYRDVLDPSILHESAFCYSYSGQRIRYGICGPAEYNKAT
jgi:hypothetical protein